VGRKTVLWDCGGAGVGSSGFSRGAKIGQTRSFARAAKFGAVPILQCEERARDGSSPGALRLEPAFRYSGVGTIVYGAFSNSCWSLLLVVSYLWGGCISCPQFLPSKGHCCETQRCKNPAEKPAKAAPQDCQTMPLERSAAAHSDSDVAARLADISVPATDLIELAQSHARAAVEFDPTAGSPPDIPVMGAALLI
jgi:hypothetical protein